MDIFSKVKTLFNECTATKTYISVVLLKSIYFRLKGKKIITHHNTIIKGLANIYTGTKTIKIGMHDVGFTHAGDKTFFNVKGKLFFTGNYTVTQGCRFYIGENAIVQIGNGGYVNANTKFIIMHGLKIGDNCFVAWDCQFLDEDYHTITYDGIKNLANNIQIGNHVWIGCHVFIYKGVNIPDDCIVAANSVVRSSFTEKNILIGGDPAKILKRNVSWK